MYCQLFFPEELFSFYQKPASCCFFNIWVFTKSVSQTSLVKLRVFSLSLLLHPHNYNSTKSGLMKQQYFQNHIFWSPSNLFHLLLPPSAGVSAVLLLTYSESSSQAVCKYLNAPINVKAKYLVTIRWRVLNFLSNWYNLFLEVTALAALKLAFAIILLRSNSIYLNQKKLF